MSEQEVYDFEAIQARWLPEWDDIAPFRSGRPDDPRPKKYVLDMFPYPSGDLHMGHAEAYALGDVIARYWAQRGFNVMHPIGWDAFGLPAENAAIKRGEDPRAWTYENIATQKASMRRYACSFDWDRVLNTCDPEYYHWNQWFFLKMLERGLAYRKKALVNWCPECATVLANEQVIDGCCWRHETTKVEQKALQQWFWKTTAYADELLKDIDDKLEGGWPDRVLAMQRNWIGRSEGTEVDFTLEGTGEKIRVFTTRVDTIFGATCVILAPEHPLAQQLLDDAGKQRAKDMVDARKHQDPGDIQKDGHFTGAYAINPYSRERVPVWIGNFVLMDYGTGAIMAVPAHDERDWEFAKKFALPIREVVSPEPRLGLGGGGVCDAEPLECFTGEGYAIHSGPLDGLPAQAHVLLVAASAPPKQLARSDAAPAAPAAEHLPQPDRPPPAQDEDEVE